MEKHLSVSHRSSPGFTIFAVKAVGQAFSQSNARGKVWLPHCVSIPPHSVSIPPPRPSPWLLQSGFHSSTPWACVGRNVSNLTERMRPIRPDETTSEIARTVVAKL